jgi:hypothetical protein
MNSPLFDKNLSLNSIEQPTMFTMHANANSTSLELSLVVI